MLKPPLSQNVYANILLMRPFMFRPSIPALHHPVEMLTILFLSLWFLTIGCPYILAQSITDRFIGSPKVPWQINADTVSFDAISSTYHARGNVIIEKQAVRLVADRVSFNQKTMTASAAGHVVMTAGDDILTGERLDLNLDQETGVVHGGTVFLKDNHFYIHGDRIEKTGKDTYQAEKGSITSCDGNRPDWIITGRTVKVNVEGYGSVTHAVFKTRNIPVLYSPYMLFPVKRKRKTGLLLPEVGFSDRKGFEWNQPFFWAINDSSDATLYAHYMHERGAKLGLEYRYALTQASHGTIMADGLQDRKIDDGTPEATLKWGYADDHYDRPNEDRYWLRTKIDHELPWDARARLDLDFVSDQDYLTEFKDGQSGFNNTRSYFRQKFGRDLDTYDENIRTNRLNINRMWTRYILNGDLLWNDNVTNRRWEETDDTLQQLPVIKFDGVKQSAFGTGVFWDLDSEYTYLYREDGPRGHRTDIYPRAYLPFNWNNYLSVQPSAGWRQTAWMMDRWEDDTLDRSNYRQIFDARLDLSTEFSKVMGSPVAAFDRIRHSVRPQVVYEYIPDQDQSDLPYFTDLDRIDEANRVTYSLTNTFTARMATAGRPIKTDDSAAVSEKRTGLPDWMQPEPPARTTFDYNRLCRFFLAQSYDIAHARNNLSEPFSDIYGELDLNFGRYLTLDSDASYNTYETRFSSHNVGATIADHRGDRLWVQHSYEKDVNETIGSRLSIKLTDRLTLRGQYERNLLAGRDILKGAGFLYKAQCWSVDFFYAEEGTDTKFAFFINLMGIGGFGQ